MKRKHRSRAERAAAVAAWRASGETAQRWATSAGIAPSTLSRWCAEEIRRNGAGVGFVRVARGAASAVENSALSSEWTVEVGELRVRIGRGTAWADVTRLLQALGRAP